MTSFSCTSIFSEFSQYGPCTRWLVSKPCFCPTVRYVHVYLLFSTDLQSTDLLSHVNASILLFLDAIRNLCNKCTNFEMTSDFRTANFPIGTKIILFQDLIVFIILPQIGKYLSNYPSRIDSAIVKNFIRADKNKNYELSQNEIIDLLN